MLVMAIAQAIQVGLAVALSMTTYKGWLKSSLADQDTLMKCDQMRLILQSNST